METSATFTRLFRGNDWANRESLESLVAVPDPPARALKVMGHIAGAELLWLERLRRVPQTAIVWPELSLSEIQEALSILQREWLEYLTSLPTDALDRSIDYVNSKGEPWSNSAREMLMHVVLHSSYHRGQIASLLGAAGQDAAYTDYIHGVRNRLF